MNNLLKLLIAYEGSACSDAALHDLRRAGLPPTAEAVVVSVAYVFLPPEGEAADEELAAPVAAALVRPARAQAERAVREARAVAERGAQKVRADFPGWAVRAEADGDAPAWAVIKRAGDLGTDLVVVGSHGHSSAGGRLILGSVSQRVLYEAPCSVRVARCTDERRAGPVRLVVGFDGSPEAEAAVGAVAARSWPGGSESRVITARHAAQAEARIAAAARLRDAGLSVSEVEREGDPAHALLREAEEWGADSIFVGTRGVHGLRHLLGGSVSSAVAASAQCSVEVVRRPQGAA